MKQTRHIRNFMFCFEKKKIEKKKIRSLSSRCKNHTQPQQPGTLSSCWLPAWLHVLPFHKQDLSQVNQSGCVGHSVDKQSSQQQQVNKQFFSGGGLWHILPLTCALHWTNAWKGKWTSFTWNTRFNAHDKVTTEMWKFQMLIHDHLSAH